MKKIALAAMISLVAGGAMAQAYVGVGVGQSKIPTDCVAGVTCKDTDTGYKLYGGYMFNKFVGAELGYIDFGKATIDVSFAHAEVKAHAVTLAAVGRGELGAGFSGVGRLGMANSSIDETSNFGFADSGSTTKLYWGLGLEYAFSKQIKGALMYDHTDGKTEGGDSGSLRLISVGIQAHF